MAERINCIFIKHFLLFNAHFDCKWFNACLTELYVFSMFSISSEVDRESLLKATNIINVMYLKLDII